MGRHDGFEKLHVKLLQFKKLSFGAQKAGFQIQRTSDIVQDCFPPRKQDVPTALNTILNRSTSNLPKSEHNRSSPLECPNTTILLVLVVRPQGHFTSRQAIRQTWGHYSIRCDVAIGFYQQSAPIIAPSIIAQNRTLQRLQAEMEVYEDLIQGKISEFSNNSNPKLMSMLRWTRFQQVNICSKLMILCLLTSAKSLN